MQGGSEIKASALSQLSPFVSLLSHPIPGPVITPKLHKLAHPNLIFQVPKELWHDAADVFTNDRCFALDFGSGMGNSKTSWMNLAKSLENTDLAKSQNIWLHLLDQRMNLS